MDADHLALYRSGLLPATDLLPQQRVLQLIAFNIKTKSSATILNHTPGTVAFAAGGRVTFGTYEGKPSTFLRGLSRGPVFSLYAADDDTGVGKLLRSGSFDAEDWTVTPNGKVLAEKVLRASQNRSELLITVGDFSRVVRLPYPDTPFILAGLGPNGAGVMVKQGTDLFNVSATGVVSAPLQPPGRRVSGYFSDHSTGQLVAINLAGGDPNLIFYDPALEGAWKMARSAFRNEEVTLVDFDDSRRELVIRTEGANDPGSIYWLHVADRKAELVGQERPALDHALAPVSFFPFLDQDGFPWIAVLTVPRGKPLRGLPAVVLANASSSRPGHVRPDMTAQALASRGYAVVQIAASDAEQTNSPDERMDVDDVAASNDADPGDRLQVRLMHAVSILVGQGTLDRKRVCVIGTGFGGYVALRSVMGADDTYRCAIALQPVVDLETLIRYPDLDTRSGGYDSAAAWRKRFGGKNLQPAALRELSPLHHADRIRTPVLLIHEQTSPETDRDPERMKDALQRAGKPVDLVKLDPGSQDLGTPAGKEKALSSMLDFLAAANPAT